MDYENEELRQQPDLESTLGALQSGEQHGGLDSKSYYGLSGLDEESAARVRPIWFALPDTYRRRVMRQLAEVSETNFELEYGAIGRMGLEDADAMVRQAAIEVLWEDETSDLMYRLIELAQHDSVREVRAAAVQALGRFILAGELGEMSEAITADAQETVIDLWNNANEDIEIRRRALEAIANSSHHMVEDAITYAYNSGDHRMRISALFAMGRTCDEKWESIVMQELNSSDPELVYEAARAAGELELERAVPHLSRLALGEDREVQEVAVWSLGEIGGKEAMRVLDLVVRNAEEADDDELLEAAEDALNNASLGSDTLYMLRFNEQDMEDTDDDDADDDR